MKVFPVAVALAAMLFVAYGAPGGYEEGEGGAGEENGGEEGGYEEGEETTQNPCVQFEEQCQTNEGNLNGQNNPNATYGNTVPPQNPQCHAWKEQCAQQNGGSTMPGGVTQPHPPEMTTLTTPAPAPPSQNTTMPYGIGRR